MAVHDELRPDSEQLPYLMASDAMRMARGLESRSMGYLGIPDTDGSETIIGPEQNGTTVVPWVGDTTAPGRPLGVTATSDMQCAIVRWDGKLEGGIPSDFRCVTVYAMRLESETDYDSEPDDSTSTADVVDTITLGDLTAAGEVASGILEVGDTYDIWAVAYDDAHDRYGNPTYNASAESEHVQVTIVPLVTREQMEQTAQEILDGAKASADAQIKKVEATMDEISDAVASNTDAIVLEQTLREEGDKTAQQATAEVKAETDKLKGDYAGMATDVASVQQSIIQVATKADTALATANGKNRRYVQPTAPADTSVLVQGDEWWQTSSKPLETYWTGEPNNSPSVLVDHSNEVEHVWVWNGSRWNEQVLSAEHLLVPGSLAVGLVAANFFDGVVIRGGAFITSNERIQLNNNGFTMVDSAGNPVVTLDAKTGAAVFQSVNIIGAGLSAPSISGGVIEGAEYSLVNGSGASAKTVAKINSTGVYFGDHLTYAKNAAGTWTLSVRGDIQSGSTISGATVVGASIYTNTQWDSSVDAEKYRGIVITSGGMFAYKNNGTEEYSMAFTADDGTLRLDGSVMANGSLTLPTITGGEVIGSNIHTSTDADNRAEMDANGFRVISNGETVIAFDVNGTVDVGTSGLASADDVSNLDSRLSADIGELDKAVQNQQGTLEDEITQRRKYLRFDSSTGLEIGEQATGDVAGCTLRLTPTRMEFRQGDTIAAYVSNDRLNINNAEIINTLTLGKFAFLPRDNGNLSLQYVG